MTLTLGHVVLVAVTTVLGASLGRFIRRRSRRLQFLNEVARAGLFLLGITAAVVLGAVSHAEPMEKVALVGFYIGAVYGLVASEPRPPRPTPEKEPSGPVRADKSTTGTDSG